jgi:hypothetical protein
MMDETPGATPRPATGTVRKKRGRGLLWTLIAVVIAFLAGFGWQYYEASAVRAELTATQQELQIERLRVWLGQAAMAAQAGEYESARQQMSGFFTRVQSLSGTLPDSVAAVTDDFLARRDEVITGLSRSNPAFAGVLYGMLERFRGAVGPMEGFAPAAEASPGVEELEIEGGLPAVDTGPAGDTGRGADAGPGADTGPGADAGPGADTTPAADTSYMMRD